MSSVVRRILIVVCAVVFCVSGGLLLKYLFLDRWFNKSEINSLKQEFSVADNDPLVFLKNLSQKYPDVKGWITIPNTMIDYPVLKSSADKSPDYYLNKNIKGESTRYGSVFIDARCNDGPQLSRSTVLYGHNIRDGSMFHDVVKFTDLKFYRERPVFTFNTIHDEMSWKIFAVFRTNASTAQGPVFDYIKVDFKDDDDFAKFIKDLQSRSLINTTVDVLPSDNIVVLSTCSYEFDDFRTVLIARKIRKGESKDVNVEDAVVNPSPVLPECYTKK